MRADWKRGDCVGFAGSDVLLGVPGVTFTVLSAPLLSGAGAVRGPEGRQCLHFQELRTVFCTLLGRKRGDLSAQGQCFPTAAPWVSWEMMKRCIFIFSHRLFCQKCDYFGCPNEYGLLWVISTEEMNSCVTLMFSLRYFTKHYTRYDVSACHVCSNVFNSLCGSDRHSLFLCNLDFNSILLLFPVYLNFKQRA